MTFRKLIPPFIPTAFQDFVPVAKGSDCPCSLLRALLGFFQWFSPCKGIQDSLGFWIPRHGLQIPGPGFQSLPEEPGAHASGFADS